MATKETSGPVAIEHFGAGDSSTSPDPGTVTPSPSVAVLTSKAAQKDIDENITPGYQGVMDSLAAHNTRLSQEQMAQQTAQQESQKNPPQNGSQTQQGGLKTVSDVPYGYNQRQVTYADGTTAIVNQTPNEDGSVSYSSDPNEIALDEARKASEKQSADFQQKADQVSSTIKQIQNGSMPLSAGENAQLGALNASYQQLIAQQKLQNTGEQGNQNIRGYQTGAAEYDPSFQVKVIGTIVNAGLNKVADLNVKLAGAVADLTQSFKDNDIKAIKDSWDVYQAAAKERSTSLQDTVTSVQKAITDSRDAMQKQAEADLKAEQDARDFKYKEQQDTQKNSLEERKFNESVRHNRVSESKNSGGSPTANSLSKNIAARLDEAAGPDGYLSPDDFSYWRKNWVREGGSPEDFNKRFADYKNPENQDYR